MNLFASNSLIASFYSRFRGMAGLTIVAKSLSAQQSMQTAILEVCFIPTLLKYVCTCVAHGEVSVEE